MTHSIQQESKGAVGGFTYLGARLQMRMKKKGVTRQVEDTLVAGNKSTQKKTYRNIKKQLQENSAEDPEENHTLSSNMWVYTGASHGCNSAAGRSLCRMHLLWKKQKNKNIYLCASAAKPGSGRHAVRQAKMSRAKEEGKEEERSECRAKGGKAKRKSVMDAGLFGQRRPDVRGPPDRSTAYRLKHLTYWACVDLEHSSTTHARPLQADHFP